MFTNKEAGRIFSKIKIDELTGCWNWTGYLSDGYGRIFYRGQRWKAHRLLYLWKTGMVFLWKDKTSPELDHICNNRACVNPDHLRYVKNKQNILRGTGPTAVNSKKTRCIHGHDALYQVGDRRRCRECRRILDASPKRKEWRRVHFS